MQSRKQAQTRNNQCIKLFNQILAFRRQFGQMPTVREMQKLMVDVTSTSTINQYLGVLTEWGWIKREGVGGRMIRITRPTEAYVPMSIRRKASEVSDRLGEE